LKLDRAITLQPDRAIALQPDRAITLQPEKEYDNLTRLEGTLADFCSWGSARACCQVENLNNFQAEAG